MTPLQTAEIRAGEIRIRLAELGGEPELTDETRAELDTLRHEYTDTERRMAALRISEPPPKATETRGSAEGRELRHLVGKASLGRMMSGIADDSEGAGADRELRQHMNLPANYIPWDMLLENRTALAVSGDEEGNVQPWINTVFPMSASAFAGVDMRTVAVGEDLIPIVGTGLTIAFPGKNTAPSESAPTASVTTLSPRRATGFFPVAKEDMLKYPMLEESWRQEMNAAIQNALDIDLLRKTGDGLLDHGTDPTAPSAATPAATFLSDVYGAVDGALASDVSQIRLLVGPESYAYMGGLVYDAGSGMTVADKLRSIGVETFVTDNAGAYAQNRQEAVVIVGPPRRNATAVTWNGIEIIRDEFTSASKGELIFTVAAFADFAILRAKAYDRKRYRRA